MHQVFESPDADGVLLVDASNAFNCLNRQTALLNIKKLCPTLSKALINTYRENIQLFIDGETILSQCGLKEENTHYVNKYGMQMMPPQEENSLTLKMVG